MPAIPAAPPASPACPPRAAACSGDPLAALTDGFRLAFFLGALLCLAGALVAAALLRPPAQVAVAEAPDPSAETEPLAA